jgi:hypothetical protein
MMFYYSNRKLTKNKVSTRKWAISVIGLAIIFGEMLKTLELWTRKIVECYKRDLLGHPSWSLEDSNANSNVDYESLVQEVSEESDISKRARDRTCKLG